MLAKVLWASGKLDDGINHIVLALVRIFAGLSMAFAHGLGKLPPNEQFVGFLNSMSLPAPGLMAWCAGLSEFVGGILIAMGLLTRGAAISLIITMLVAVLMAHGSDPFSKKEMGLLYLSLFSLFAVMGPGKWSLDGIVLKRKGL